MAPVSEFSCARESSGSQFTAMTVIGTTLSAVGYGLVVSLIYRRNSPRFVVSTRLWFLAMATAALALQIRWTVAVVRGRTLVERNTGLVYLLTNITSVFLTWSADGISLWRFYVIFGRNKLYISGPAVIYIANLAVGSLHLWTVSAKTLDPHSLPFVNYSLAYWTISLGLRVIVTCAVVSRLLLFKRHLSLSSSPCMLDRIAIVLIQSAAIETAASLAYVGCVGVESVVQVVFFPVLEQVQAIGPLLIFCRLLRRDAYETKCTATMTTPRFGDVSLAFEATTSPERTKKDTLAYPNSLSLQLHDNHKQQNFKSSISKPPSILTDIPTTIVDSSRQCPSPIEQPSPIPSPLSPAYLPPLPYGESSPSTPRAPYTNSDHRTSSSNLLLPFSTSSPYGSL